MPEKQSKIQIGSIARIFHYKQLNIHFFVIKVEVKLVDVYNFSCH